MNFFKKLIKNITSLTESEEEVKPSLQSYDSGELPLDELFVKNFISKGGSSSIVQIPKNLSKICYRYFMKINGIIWFALMRI